MKVGFRGAEHKSSRSVHAGGFLCDLLPRFQSTRGMRENCIMVFILTDLLKYHCRGLKSEIVSPQEK